MTNIFGIHTFIGMKMVDIHFPDPLYALIIIRLKNIFARNKTSIIKITKIQNYYTVVSLFHHNKRQYMYMNCKRTLYCE